jgi:basic membrane protein A and related proteins
LPAFLLLADDSHSAIMRWRGSVLLCVILLGACSPQPQPQDCARADIFCVGLVTDFGKVDSGINHEAWLGLQDAQVAHLVDRVDYIETVDVRDRQANIAALADDGYDVIVTVGAAMSKVTVTAAAKYKKTSFIGIEQPQDKRLNNLTGLVFHEERSGFLAGALAALVTQTGYVAAVCEARFVDPIRRYCDGFAAGARYARPNIQVTVGYRDGPTSQLYNDPNWGNAAALQLVHEGADVLFAAGGNTARAALETAAANRAFVIGSETDLYGDLTQIRPLLLTSAVNDVRGGMLELLRRARRAELPSGEYVGETGLAPWHDLDRQIPADVKDNLEKIKLGLAAGTITLDIPYKAP